ECDQTKRRGKVEGREKGKGTGDREGNAGEGTNGLEVTGSSKRDAVCPGVSTTVAHSSSFLKPTKGPTCNAERKERKRNKEGKKESRRQRDSSWAKLVARQISRRGGCWRAHHWLNAKAPTVHEGQLSANNQSEMVDLLLHGAAGLAFPGPCDAPGLHVAATSTRSGCVSLFQLPVGT
ncbi:hypothetical protein BO79DRAFT_278896, partial [Aspergillus costaricaensis CBS 115574]